MRRCDWRKDKVKKYYIYKKSYSNEINAYLARTEEDIKRVDEILNDSNSCCKKISSFEDALPMFFEYFRISMNSMMLELGSIIRFETDPITARFNSPNRACWNIKIYDKFLDSFILNMNNDFYDLIESIFDTFEFEYSYNNTRSCVFISRKED